MMVGSAGAPLLWDAAMVIHWLRRDDRYQRIKPRAENYAPTLSIASFADVLAALALRVGSPEELDVYRDEILATFTVIGFGVAAARVYAEKHKLVVGDISEAASSRTASHFWNASLSQLHGIKILANEREPYHRLVALQDLL